MNRRSFSRRRIASLIPLICIVSAFADDSFYVVAPDSSSQQISQFVVSTTEDDVSIQRGASLRLPFNPTGVAFDAGRNNVITTGGKETGSVATVALQADGRMQLLESSSLDHPVGYSSVDRRGRYFMTANYRSGTIAVYQIEPNGIVGRNVCSLKTPNAEAHCILTTADNRFAYIPCVKNNNALFQFAFDEDTGQLSPLDPFDVEPPAMFGPRHVAYHPSLPVAYFSNEQQLGVSVFRIGTDGQLSDVQHATTMPRRSPFIQGKRGLHASDLVVSSDGTRLWVAVRDFVADDDSVFSFQIGDDGKLSLQSRTKVGDIPWKLDLSPDGRHLLVSESGDQTLSVFRIGTDGSLDLAERFHWEMAVRDMVVVGGKVDVAEMKAAQAEKVEIPLPEVLTDYRPYISGDNEVVVWYGRRVALVLDEDNSINNRDVKTMQRVVTSLDEIFDAYDRVTGRRPKLTSPLRGRIRIEVSSKVGGGLAHHGRLGVAIGDGFFDGLYKRFANGQHTVDQVFFYEIARNYWMADMNPSIDYHTSKGPQDYGWWTVGFNNAMSIFLPHEIKSIDDMYYFGSNGQQFSDGMEANLNTYLAAPNKYNWDNSWNVPLIPWKERTSVNDLMTGLLIRLHREHGGSEFISRLYAEIPKRKPLASRSDRQGARDNFYESASIATKKNLYEFFSNDLRWNISKERQTAVAERLNAKD